MKLFKLFLFVTIFGCLFETAFAQNTNPVVSNVHFAKRTDGSIIVDVYYDVTDADGNSLTVTMLASNDNGTTWTFPCSSITGNIGAGITSGTNKHIVWNFGADHPNYSSTQIKIKIIADDGIPDTPVLAGPANGVMDLALPAVFSWNASTGAVSYSLQIASDTGFTNLAYNQSISGTSQSVSGLTGLTKYYWRLRSVNGQGSSNWTGRWSFTTAVGGTAPSIPLLASPSDNATELAIPPTLAWNSSTGAVTYTLQVSTSNTFASLFYSDSTLTGISKQIAGLANSTLYYWRVNAKNSYGTSNWSNIWSFTSIEAAPSVPVLASPLNNAIDISLTPTLSWNSSSSAKSYLVQVSSSSSFSTFILNDSSTTITKQISGLTNSTVYYWRVAAKNNNGTSSWSSVYNFTTVGVAPNAPTLTTPANNAVDIAIPPTLAWNASTGAATYTLQISTSSTFTSTIFSDSTLSSVSKQITGLANSTQYFWRVNAKNSYGTSTWSNVFSFITVGVAPSIPTLATPSNNAVDIAIPPTLAWNASTGAATYTLQISTSSTFISTLFSDSTLTSVSKQITGLSNSTQYFWRVNAKNSYGTSSWSNVWSFTTVSVAPNGFVLVEGGTFTMGDATYATPLHSVTLSSFYISKTEVTQGQWKTVIGGNPSYFSSLGDNGPVEQVTWYDCINYCNKLSIKEGKIPCYNISGNTSPSDWTSGTIVCDFTAKGYRLPTEAEWEYAARGGNISAGYIYSGSNSVDDVVWYSNNSGNTTHAVGTKAPNELNINDMNGNVCEWCWDWYSSYTSSSQSNPTGATSGSNRVMRSGSYNGSAINCLPGYRNYNEPPGRFSDGGFRVVLSNGTTPNAPILQSPSTGAVDVALPPKLTWNASLSAVNSYTLQVSTDAGFASFVYNQSGLTSTSQQVTGLSNSTKYYWRVSAVNIYGASNWSSVYNFTTIGVAPGTPTLATPANNTNDITLPPTLTWNASSGAVTYTLQVSTSSSFTSFIFNDSTLTSVSKQISGLANSTIYYWRVNAKNSYGTSSWSSVYNFTTTGVAPNAPTLATPANNAVNIALPPTLTWNASAGASSYTLQVSASSSFSSFVYNQSGLSGTSQQITGLSNSNQYYWRVNAMNNYGTSAWSNVSNFTTLLNTTNGFVLVESGTFTMGSSIGSSNELPLHSVTLSSYYISKAEVTQGQYRAVVGSNPSNFGLGDNAPVEQVTWYDCISYCNKLSVKEGKIPCYSIGGITSPVDWTSGTVECDFGAKGYRLPTEAEWEYASRGGNKSVGYVYSGSNTIDSVGWVNSNSGNTTHVIGTKIGNELGLYDMSGNVSEWCWDGYDVYYKNSQTDPTGNGASGARVFRGGSWNEGDNSSRSSNRRYGIFDFKNFDLGFRVVISNGTAPNAPTLQSPSTGAVDVILLPTNVVWNASNLATSYEVQVSTDISFGSFYSRVLPGYILNYQMTGLANLTQYYWRVKATNTYGTSSWSDIWTFTTIGTVPNVPALSTPANNAIDIAVNPTLTWSTSTGAASYTLQVSTSSSFTSFIFNDSTLTSVSQQITGLTNNALYYWRVNAKNSYGTSTWSSVWSFTTTSTPSGFVLVQSGTYTMGSSNGKSDELPLHSVTLSSYYLSKTEVTQGQYKAVMVTNPSNFNSVGDDGPVEQVAWYDCINYCNKLSIKEGKNPCYSISGNTNPSSWTSGTIVCDFTAQGYRLPTEAEWEYAARGGNKSAGFTYSGSNTLNDVAWNNSNSGGTTHLVGIKTANELGINDMSGNVLEWCWDWYDSYSSTSQTNPAGASSGSYRVLRGGCWNDGVNYCRSSDRNLNYLPTSFNNGFGFRLVLSNGTAPNTPTLQSPSTGAIDVNLSPTLTWNANSDAVNSYTLQVSTSNSFTSLIFSDSSLTSVSKQITGLANSTMYYWRVNAKNSYGTSPWSSIYNFTTVGIAPSTPTLATPENNAIDITLPPMISWNASTDAVTYTLQVSTSSSFTSFIFNDSTLTSVSQQISGLANSTIYYWRVNAKNSYGTSSWSSVWSFTTIKSNTPSGFVFVAGGTFIMGDTLTGTPFHSVTLSSYYISKTELTQGQWVSVMGSNPSLFTSVGNNAPVEKVTWFDCINYCNKLSLLEGKTPCYSIAGNTAPSDWTSGTVVCDFSAKGYRLPTEAEWEFAAKGGNKSAGYKYSGSNTMDSVSWNTYNSGNTTHVVSTKKANELGISDMSGNVQEWCWDWYGAYSSASLTNPTGIANGTSRMLRGGSWYNDEINCLPGNRYKNAPDNIVSKAGFRLVLMY